jgi:AraC family transcriptional regulator
MPAMASGMREGLRFGAMGGVDRGMFHPRMTSSIEGISVVGELKWRAWEGGVADVWSVDCAAGARGAYISQDPRLFIVLDMQGPGTLTLDPLAEGAARRHAGPRSISYIPAGYPIGGRSMGVTHLRHLDLHLDAATLMRRFAGALQASDLDTPRLAFQDERIAALAHPIAAECASETPLHDLYGEGLLNALLVALFGIEPREGRRRSPLSRRQLQRVQAYIEDHCLENIRLSNLADIAGLSQSYFSHAFKAATGIAPYRWHMQARIRQVQALLMRKQTSLTEVAAVAGFSDQAHFTRVFKQHVGVTPAAWLRNQAA